ncbi:MAG: amidohydrolase [Desulfurellaceae bacterium]|nr:amidohydrolase [Desulfurellaceae bacterium]
MKLLKHFLLSVACVVWAWCLAGVTEAAVGEEDRQRILASIDARQSEYAALARRIWELAELGYQEEHSAAALQKVLREAGFALEAGVAGMPTAFVATAGAGKPVIGVLAEFDALPGLSQAAVPERKPIARGEPGHACGHHLFGTASVAAAVAVRDWLHTHEHPGTIRLYGTPAEEGGAGKVYMTRAGLFDDVDVVLHWHPSDRNKAGAATTLANKSAKFRFHGHSVHAAFAPHRGRSALDGVEAMNYMVNLLREHVEEEARLHYVITHGGLAPNVVPEFAEVFYYVRHVDGRRVEETWQRVVAAAEGAARGTGTRMEYEVIHGIHSLLPNEVLARLVDTNLRRIGGVTYTEEEQRFALALQETLGETPLPLGSQQDVQPFAFQVRRSSTDVGDVSWMVPTAGFSTATWVPGTPAHSWQAVAAGGMSIGVKGMLVAAKTLALTAIDLLIRPEVIQQAWTEFEERRGTDFQYRPLLGDRAPPLDYRR